MGKLATAPSQVKSSYFNVSSIEFSYNHKI